jgi:hypothetical protein
VDRCIYIQGWPYVAIGCSIRRNKRFIMRGKMREDIHYDDGLRGIFLS